MKELLLLLISVIAIVIHITALVLVYKGCVDKDWYFMAAGAILLLYTRFGTKEN